MFSTSRFLARAAPAVLVTAGIAGVAAASAASQVKSGPLSCEIRQQVSGGMLTLQGVATADSDMSGSYRLKISGGSGGGSSTINQGGEFSASAGEDVTLGRVTVNAGGYYDVTLEVSGGGHSARCADTAGGNI